MQKIGNTIHCRKFCLLATQASLFPFYRDLSNIYNDFNKDIHVTNDEKSTIIHQIYKINNLWISSTCKRFLIVKIGKNNKKILRKLELVFGIIYNGSDDRSKNVYYDIYDIENVQEKEKKTLVSRMSKLI